MSGGERLTQRQLQWCCHVRSITHCPDAVLKVTSGEPHSMRTPGTTVPWNQAVEVDGAAVRPMERTVLGLCRDLGYGELRVSISGGTIVGVDVIAQTTLYNGG